MINKVHIAILIVDYLVIIISDILTTIPPDDLRAFEISIISNFACFGVCNFIFGVIIN